MKYTVITPVRNEGEHLRQTVRSMTAQTIKPHQWIVVDDGSTDDTLSILEDAARHNPWVLPVRRSDRGFRSPGAGVVEAFYEGLHHVEPRSWDVLVKLDGDLVFEPDYFERALQTLEREPMLGITGGDIYHFDKGNRVLESKGDPFFHVRGATKLYRRECWDTIGGLIRSTGWDTLDEVKATMLGWQTRRIPELQLLHLKPTGAADGVWRNAFKNGRGSFICGYHPVYLLGRCARRLFRVHPFVESAGLFAGYFSSYFSGVERADCRATIRFLRRQQVRKVFGLPSLWDENDRYTSTTGRSST